MLIDRTSSTGLMLLESFDDVKERVALRRNALNLPDQICQLFGRRGTLFASSLEYLFRERSPNQVVPAVRESHLRDLLAKRHPVDRNVVKHVCQEQARHCYHAKIIDRRAFCGDQSLLLKLGVFMAELKRDKRCKALCLFVKFSNLYQVDNNMFRLSNMPKAHRAVAL